MVARSPIVLLHGPHPVTWLLPIVDHFLSGGTIPRPLGDIARVKRAATAEQGKMNDDDGG